MVDIEKLFIKNEEVELEAEYFQSKEDSSSGVLICHPHPQMGGNMWNNVVTAIFSYLISKQISCLRFNFRAVGRSTGKHGDGEEERTDVKSCINFLINDKNLERILICGYSYGAAIGCSTINYSDKIIGCIAISFPWDFMGFSFKKKAQSDKPKLFIQGDRDFIAHFNHFSKHYQYYKDPKKEIIIKGADHFWGGREDRLAELINEFYRSII